MVRLRSDRWYSADGQHRSRGLVGNHTSNSRRLISLCFLLGLVILLMQRASDPAHVRNFFSALGVPLEEESPIESVDFGDQVRVVTRDDSPSSTIGSRSVLIENRDPADSRISSQSRWQTTCGDLVTRLLDESTSEQQRELAEVWFAIVAKRMTLLAQSGRSSEEMEINSSAVSRTTAEGKSDSSPELLALKNSTLKTLADLTGRFGKSDEPRDRSSTVAGEDDWSEQLTRFVDQWRAFWQVVEGHSDASESGELLARLDPDFRAALEEHLDATLLDGLRDASPWTADESACFWRLMAKTTQMDESTLAGADLISTQQLQSEMDFYRGTPIRFRGSLRQLEYTDRSRPEYAIEGYWVAWLRGSDDSVQPVAVYGLDKSFARWSTVDLSGPDYPELEILALPAKKMAYASQQGVEIAPTLFAVAVGKLSRQSAADSAWNAGMGNADIEEVGQDFMFAALLGLLLAGFILVPVLLSWHRSPVVRPRGVFKPKDVSRSRSREEDSSGDAPNMSLGWILLFASLSSTVSPSIVYAQEPVADQEPSSRPPWATGEDPESRRAELLQERLASLFDAEQLNRTLAFLKGDTQEISDDSLKMLRVLQQMQWPNFHSNQSFDVASEKVRVESFAVEGYVVSAEAVELTRNQQDWFQLNKQSRVYRLVIETSEPSQSISVLCVDVPNLWIDALQLKQYVSLRGHAVVLEADSIALVFAESPQWLLPAESEMSELAPTLPAHWLPLGKLGWDLARIDRLVANEQKALQKDESEGLLELLRFVELISNPTDASLAPLEAMGKPGSSFARPIHWQVRLVNGSVVPLESLQERKILGQDYYIQFDGFVQIGNQRVRYRVGDEDIAFEREFPITIITRSTDRFVPHEELSSGVQAWEIGQYAEVDGLFYRLWSYQSELMQQKGNNARQVAPLVIASNLKASVPPLTRATAGEIGWFGYALCLATLVILAAVLVIASRNMRRRAA